MQEKKIKKLKKDTILKLKNDKESELHSLFGEYVIKLIEEINKTNNNSKIIDDSFDYFNELANLNDSRIDNILGTSVFIDLWTEFADNEEKVIVKRLNPRALNLYRENIKLWKQYMNDNSNNQTEREW